MYEIAFLTCHCLFDNAFSNGFYFSYEGYYKGLNKISKGFDSGLLTRMILFDP